MIDTDSLGRKVLPARTGDNRSPPSVDSTAPAVEMVNKPSSSSVGSTPPDADLVKKVRKLVTVFCDK